MMNFSVQCTEINTEIKTNEQAKQQHGDFLTFTPTS